MSIYRSQGRTPPLEEPPVDVESIEDQFLRSMKRHESFNNWMKAGVYIFVMLLLTGLVFGGLFQLDRLTKECEAKGGTLLNSGQCVQVLP